MARHPARRLPDAALAVAQFGLAQTFFGNLYEAVARIPDRLAHERVLAVPAGGTVSLPVMLRSGSPVRYHLPTGQLVLGATVTALVSGRHGAPERRRRAAVSAAGTLVAAASTAYVVRSINVPLFFTADAPPPVQREVLLRRWYALNALRMAVTALAWLAARRARST